MIEARELEFLSPLAAFAAKSQGRARQEPSDPIRTVFMRDRDRILHSKPFRRLKHKTQVFIDPQGDHYRTRLTHTLEVAQVARTIGRALRLNEDLIEAIALGHDVGHTPFGHAGEFALDEVIREVTGSGGFSHSDQSLRILDILLNLNLTAETLAGIGGHSKGRSDLTAYDGELTSTLEAAVVRISDRIAYLNHDLDDALRAGILTKIPPLYDSLGSTHGHRMSTIISDVIDGSWDKSAIAPSQEMLDILNSLKEFLFENVYHLYPKLFPDIAKAQSVVRELFVHFVAPGNLPDGYSGVQGAIDYVSGMTDRFAIDTFIELRLPAVWRVT